MIVNKSMFPLQTGFGVISKMQDKFATLQMQLGTGEKASKLSEMGRDLPMSLSVRSRLGKIEGFSANIDTVNLRLSFLDNAMTRFDKIEGEARNAAIQGQYGTNNINMATLPSLSKARLDELVMLLNSDVAGRYLFGGSNTDSAPLPTTDVLLNGQGGKAGYNTVLGERKAADAGLSGLGRLMSSIGATPPNDTTVSLTEDGIHPFGLKLSNVFSNAGAAVELGDVEASATGVPQLGDTLTVKFNADPTQQMQPGQTITMGFVLPDGGETQLVMTAIAPEDAPPGPGQFVVTDDPVANAASFQTALDSKLKSVVGSEVAAASTFAAAKNFFNGPGEPPLRVSGDPATSLKVATEADTIMWYSGQSPAVSASNLGRLEISNAAVPVPLSNPQTFTHQVTLAQQAPASGNYGFQISGTGANNAITVEFSDAVATVPGEKIEFALKEPPPSTVERTVALTAVVGKAGPGQFTIGANAEATAENFSKALNTALTGAAVAAEGNPRQSVTAQVDDATRVSYGMQANESGFLALVRTMAAMSVETYPTTTDPVQDQLNRSRFDAMATRQQSAMSEAHNSEMGSIEIMSMELAVAGGTLQNATARHTNYKAQLDNLLSDIETVSKEDVAMEILALQTRLQASYQTTSMISKLSLVNYM